MSHGGHFVSSGTSAKRFMSGAELGLDPDTAAFVAAHCSPFVAPTQLDVNPRVPDTKTHANTAYAYLHAEFQVPVQATGGSGEFFLGSIADPLAPLPIFWSFTPGVSAATSPNDWASRYQAAGLGALMAQCKALSEVSRKHRIVGHAIKANVGRNNTIERGIARGGHFLIEDTRQQTNDLIAPSRYLSLPVPTQEESNTGCGTVNMDGVEYLAGEMTYPVNAGISGQCLMNPDVSYLRAAIRDARENECTGKADDGMSVRWSPISDFNFQKTVNRHVVVPTNKIYSNGFPTSRIASAGNAGAYANLAGNIDYAGLSSYAAIAGTSATPIKQRSYYFSSKPGPSFTDSTLTAHNVYDICVHSIDSAASGAISPAQDISELGTIRSTGKTGSAGTGATSGNVDLYNDVTTAGRMVGHIFYAADQDAISDGLIHIGNNRYMKYTDPEANFERGCFIDFSGLTTDQIVNIEVVWHVEFMPKDYHLNPGRPSPINLEWETLQATIGNEQAFPLVVQGNSFFSSLWKGIKKAGRLGTKIAKVAAPIVGSIPSPYAQGAAAALGTGATVGTLMFE